MCQRYSYTNQVCELVRLSRGSKMQAQDSYNMTVCLWREARNQNIDAKRGVYWVIINRANDEKGRWPKTISEVILQPLQFSSFNRHDLNYVVYPFPFAHAEQCPSQGEIFTIIDQPGDDPTG